MVGIVCLILVISGFFSSLLATVFLRLSTNPRKHIDSIIKILLGIGAFGLTPLNCEALEDLGKPIQEVISVNGFYFLVNVLGLPLAFISTLPGEY